MGVIAVTGAWYVRRSVMEKVLTLNEVAEMIRVPRATLRYWRHQGTGPMSFKMGPRRVMVL